MGAYLDKPERTKHSGSGGDANYSYGFSSMQGWRRTQEDAHAAVVDLDGSEGQSTGTGFFAVYDGHGGAAVARYCALHLHKELRAGEPYRGNRMGEGLTKAYLAMDVHMCTLEAEAELRELAKDVMQKPQITPLGTSLAGSYIDDAEGDDGEGGGDGAVVVPPGIVERLRAGSLVKNGANASTDNSPVGGPGAVQQELKGGSGEPASAEKKRSQAAAGLAFDAEAPAGPESSADGYDVARRKSDMLAGGDGRGHGGRSIRAKGEGDDAEAEEGFRSPEAAPMDDDGGPARSDPSRPLDSTPPSQTFGEVGDPIPPTTGGLVQGPSAGCTAITAVVRGSELTVANCGDSRCVLSRGGVAVAMSEDHKPDNPIEAARIDKAKCYVVDGRVNGVLNLSRAIGDAEFKRSTTLPPAEQAVTADPEIRTAQLRLDAPVSLQRDKDDAASEASDEFMVLACDGIFDVKTNQEVVDFVRGRLREGLSLKDSAEALLDECLAKDSRGTGVGCDNMSAVVVTFRNWVGA